MTSTILTGRRNAVVLVVGAMVAVVASGSVAMARGGAARVHEGKARAAAIATNTSGGVCKAGFDTEQDQLVPPDDNPNGNLDAGFVRLTKKCSGAVSITFSSETNTSGAGDFIDMFFFATCTGTGGYTHHCTVGNQKAGSPGETLFQHNVFPETQTQSVTEVFSGLKRGKWLFEAVPGGNNHAFLRSRTTMVQAYSGG
jgi:hypothetical protein